jgi:glutamate/tyrosine decarboxylase-like PLP-dependent enzyme
MFDYLEHIRERPVWQPIPDEARAHFQAALPRAPTALQDAYGEFSRFVVPYGAGNVHPGFMGWAQGGGTAVGMLAEMLAGGLNPNLGGRDHMPIEVERQIVAWVRTMFGFPQSASGLFVTGASAANFLAVLIARTVALGTNVRQSGILLHGGGLRAYGSAGAHICITEALEISGLGSDALRQIPMDSLFRMDAAALRDAIAEDRASGLTPFLVVGTAGTVDTGAVDDLAALGEVCHEENISFHVDGALGGLAIWSPELAPLLRGIEHADSIAFDFHKWGQVPYSAGFLLVRDGERHRETFASPASYLRRETRGLAAGSPWPCDYGPDLSRGFQALKTWFTLKTYGTDRLGTMIAQSCALARYLEQRVHEDQRLELLAPVALNIVCFRFRHADADAVNAEIVVNLQESGIVAPSTTRINGRIAIRAAFVNHRTQRSDVDALVDAVIRLGTARAVSLELEQDSESGRG